MSHLDVVHAGDEAHLAVHGDLDHHVAHAFDVELRDALARGARRLEIDLSDAPALDISGARTLLSRACDVRARGGSMSVSGAAEAPRRLLEALGLQLLVGLR